MSENKNKIINDFTEPETDVSATESGIELSSEAKKLMAKEGFNAYNMMQNGTAVKKRFSLLDFWFYYKWHILIVLFFAVIFTTLIVQAVTKEKFDVRVLYAGPAVLTDTERTAVCDALNQQLDIDFNGDGKKNSELFDLILMNNEEVLAMYEKGVSDYFLNPSIINDNKETLSVNAMAGEYVIFLIDIDYYQTLHDNSVFIPLDEMGIACGERYDECSVYLKSLDVAKFYTAFNVFPEDTLICVKRLSSNTKKKYIPLWEENKRYFKLLTEFKLPEGFVPAE